MSWNNKEPANLKIDQLRLFDLKNKKKRGLKKVSRALCNIEHATHLMGVQEEEERIGQKKNLKK